MLKLILIRNKITVNKIIMKMKNLFITSGISEMKLLKGPQ
jgi:hypothetical protein